MKFEIIPTSEEYIDGFHAALDEVAREKKYIGFLKAPPLENLRRFVRNNIAQESIQYLALIEDKVVAWVDITKSDRAIYNHIGYLGIGVIKAYRSKGLGRVLLQRALDEARNQGLTRIELTVREGNDRAITLYEKLGFKVEGIKKNAVRLEGVYENVIFMALLWDE